MNKIEFGSDYEGISALGIGQDRYLYIVSITGKTPDKDNK
jgi:hypothetical protein